MGYSDESKDDKIWLPKKRVRIFCDVIFIDEACPRVSREQDIPLPTNGILTGGDVVLEEGHVDEISKDLSDVITQIRK